jgi:hypothetical protein
MGALQSIAKRRLMLDIPFSRPLAGIGHRVPFGRKKKSRGNAGPVESVESQKPASHSFQKRAPDLPNARQACRRANRDLHPLHGVYFCTRPVRTSAV